MGRESISGRNRSERRALASMREREARQFTKAMMVNIPYEDWPPNLRIDDRSRIAVFRDRDFLAQIFNTPPGYRISVNRIRTISSGSDWADGVGWDDLQRIKNQCGFEDKCAVELYPPADSVVNVANMRHLFVLPEPPKYMWGFRNRPDTTP